jgi:hypothetical protein
MIYSVQHWTKVSSTIRSSADLIFIGYLNSIPKTMFEQLATDEDKIKDLKKKYTELIIKQPPKAFPWFIFVNNIDKHLFN